MKKFIITALIMLVSISLWCQTDACKECARTATLDQCTLNDPMGIVNPDAYILSVFSHLAEMMTQPCFHFTNSEIIEDYMKQARNDGTDLNEYLSEYREPEYSFEADFVSGLDEYNDEGRPVRSRLTISMFFNGEQRELVNRWQTRGTWDIPSNSGTSWSQHFHFYKEGMDIMEIIERFEKKPLSCTISPGKEEVAQGESIEIKVTDFKDLFGQDSREFNRIVVHAMHGKIRNGESCKIGPDYRVFKVEDGNVTIQYNAPDDCKSSEDKITVYNSCDVLPEATVPLSDTRADDEIAVKDLKLICTDALITITARRHKEIRSSEQTNSQVNYCNIQSRKSHDLDENIEATIKVSLKVERSADMPLYNQRWVYYAPLNASISWFRLSYKERTYDYSNQTGVECASGGCECIFTLSKTPGTYNIAESPPVKMTRWIVVYDARTNKALKIIPGGYSITYSVSEDESLKTKKWPDDTNNPSYSKNTVIENISFEAGPVEDPVPDPTGQVNPNFIKDYLKDKVGEEKAARLPDIPIPAQTSKPAEIKPDVLVTKGDGITQLGGEGRKSESKEITGGRETEEWSYSWDMKITKKK